MMRMILMLGLIQFACGCASQPWRRLPSIPDREGLAGAYAGVSGGALIVAGGANFPEKRPWEGGKKIWYDTIYALDEPDGQWKMVGQLPRPLGYGVSLTYRNAILCIGGSDSERHYADSFRIEYAGGQIITTPLPPLPKPIANACGAIVGDVLYIAGGIEKPDARETLRTVFMLNLAAGNPAWSELPPIPGQGRMLAIAAAFDKAFYVVGGIDLPPGPAKLGGPPVRQYLGDAYRYDPATGWKRLADLPHPLAAAPSPAATDEAGLLIFGGDDGSHVGFTSPESHPGFANQIAGYEAKVDQWRIAGAIPAPRVTTPLVRWGDWWVIPSGEARPGVRSAEVWGYKFFSN